jgi:drug/metabolite transporter (DMT)-like permease
VNSRTKLLLAFAAVYVIWGSTYLGIRYAIETIPPLLMAGTRFVTAGLVLLIWGFARGASWPRWAEWRTAFILGFLLLLFGNGGVTLAEQRITSGMAALLVASEPLWLAALAWIFLRGKAPNRMDSVGLVLGFVGVSILIAPWNSHGGTDFIGAGLVMMSAITWAAGSLYSIGAPQHSSKTLANGMTMLLGGSLQLLAGLARGEAAEVHWESMSLVSTGALLYLTLFGSLIGFSAYTYLLSATTPAKASTYAFVNPVVAVLLGWSIAGEPLSSTAVLAMVAIVGGVVLVTVSKAANKPAPVRSLAAEHASEAA